jgi:hypothetical protein
MKEHVISKPYWKLKTQVNLSLPAITQAGAKVNNLILSLSAPDNR